MFYLTEIWNNRLGNALDVDLKITLLQNVLSHQNYNEKRKRQVRLNEKGNRACDNSKNNDDHKIYASMA